MPAPEQLQGDGFNVHCMALKKPEVAAPAGSDAVATSPGVDWQPARFGFISHDNRETS